MLKVGTINVGNLFLSMSDALDLVTPSLSAHQQRTAYICWVAGKAMKLPDDRLERLFVAALLHDIGALTAEEKISLHNSEVTDPSRHCLNGEVLFRSTPWLKSSADIVKFHHTPWSAHTDPLETAGVLESQLLLLADTLERAIDRNRYILAQYQQLNGIARTMAGSEAHPDVVDAFLRVSHREEFWLDLVSPRLYSILLRHGPYRKQEIDLEDLASLALLFRNIIDFRSPFTATHSSGVSECAACIARLFGLADHDVQMMGIAGNFHDLGKLVIPSAILEKPAKLTDDEYAVIRQHTYWTYSILNSIGGLDQIAEWAAFHHEKLDGSGYPFHLTDDRLSSGARIMAVADTFTALTEARPYRPGMTKDEVTPLMRAWAERNHLDKNIVALAFDHYDDIVGHVQQEQAITHNFYEHQFQGLA